MKRKWVGGVLGALCALSFSACKQTAILEEENPGGTSGGAAVVITPGGTISLGCGTVSVQLTANTTVTWKSTNTGVATVSESGVVTRVAGTKGTAAVIAKSAGGAADTVTVVVDDTNCGGAASISFTPHGGNYFVGDSISLNITCTNVSCTNVQILSSDASVIRANLVTKALICIAPGSATITVQPAAGSTSPSDQASFTCMARAVTPVINPPGPFTVHTGQGCTISSLTFNSNVAGDWNLTNSVLAPFQGTNQNTKQVVLMPVAGLSGTTSLTVTANGQTSNPVVITLDNSACSSSNTFTISGPSSISSGQSCTNTTAQLQYNMNGAAYTGSVSWTSSNPGIATVSNTGVVTAVPGQSGSVTITATGGGGSASITVTVSNASCATQQITVTVIPSTFALTVGQQPSTFQCVVQGTSAGQSTGCNWSSYIAGTNQTGANCVSLVVIDPTHVSVAAIAGCTQQIEIRATAVADVSKFGSSFGTTSSGNVTCVITWNGTTTGTIMITRPNSTTATVSCTNQFGASFRPFGYTDHPEIFTVNGSSGVKDVNGVNWAVGPIFTLNPVFTGSGTFTVQADLTDKTVIASRPVTVQ